MKTKALSLTLAGLMSVQSIGFANEADRTAGIGDQAITAAKTNLQTLNHEILLLDQALSKAADSITKRDDRGGFTNGIAVAGAGLGLGLSAMSYLSFRKGGEGSGIGGMFLATFSIGATLSSLGNGATSQALKTKAETTELEKQLSEAQKSVETAMAQTSDKATAVALTQMGLAIKNTQSSLSSYQAQESEVSRNRLVAQASQLVGTAILVYGITQENSRLPMLGLMIMNAGNIGAVLSGLQGSEAQDILKEINQTRDSLKVVSAALQ